MLNSTCRLLSNGYKFSVKLDGSITYRPCCIFKKEFAFNSKAELALQHATVAQLNSYTDASCAECNFLEKNNIRQSHRSLGFDFVPEYSAAGDPTFLELQISNTCNGGCIMCGPDASSYWAQELKQAQPNSKKDWLEYIATLVDLKQVKYLRILGGEPMLMDIEDQFVDLVKDVSDVDLQFTTNASIYPSAKKVSQWEKFKSVRISFSADGIGERFDYIRYPLKWSTVESNILKMQDSLLNNTRIKINHTVNTLNLYYYSDFVEWLDKNFNAGSCSFTPAFGVLSPKIVTTKLKDKIVDKYGVGSKPSLFIESDQLDPYLLTQYLKDIDNRRGSSWGKVFPEIIDCL